MTTPEKSESAKRKEKEEETNLAKRAGTFETFMHDIERNIEKAFTRQWPSAFDWRFPSLQFGAWAGIRTPLCDMVDKGDRYEVQMEVPGIEKEKLDLKATINAIEISGEQTEKMEEKNKTYVYNERSYKSFHRRIPIPEEVVPSKVNAKMVNGVLIIELPKKSPTKVEEETAKVKVE